MSKLGNLVQALGVADLETGFFDKAKSLSAMRHVIRKLRCNIR